MSAHDRISRLGLTSTDELVLVPFIITEAVGAPFSTEDDFSGKGKRCEWGETEAIDNAREEPIYSDIIHGVWPEHQIVLCVRLDGKWYAWQDGIEMWGGMTEDICPPGPVLFEFHGPGNFPPPGPGVSSSYTVDVPTSNGRSKVIADRNVLVKFGESPEMLVGRGEPPEEP